MRRDVEGGFRSKAAARSVATMLMLRAGLCLAVIICGLILRRCGLGWGLPALVVKYGGSLLWGTMVFLLVAMATSRLSRQRMALIAVAIALGVELFRLAHAPWLDAFRLTPAGALLLGRVFSAWNMLAYGIGIALGALVDHVGAWAPARAGSNH
jgi:hypothetical protein